MSRSPLLFVDIDGVISLFGFEEADRPPGSFHSVDGIPHFISAAAGAYLLDLSAHFELVWCSGWEDRANEHLPHLLDLPGPLPHLVFVREPDQRHAHWKLDAITAHAGERPLAWIDDALDDECHEWAERRGAPTLLVATQPASGLTAELRDALVGWARGLALGEAPGGIGVV